MVYPAWTIGPQVQNDGSGSRRVAIQMRHASVHQAAGSSCSCDAVIRRIPWAVASARDACSDSGNTRNLRYSLARLAWKRCSSSDVHIERWVASQCHQHASTEIHPFQNRMEPVHFANSGVRARVLVSSNCHRTSVCRLFLRLFSSPLSYAGLSIRRILSLLLLFCQQSKDIHTSATGIPNRLPYVVYAFHADAKVAIYDSILVFIFFV